MRIGIVGPADRAVAWEKHLRPHPSVSEVVIAAKQKEVGEVDAYFLIDDGEQRLKNIIRAIKTGCHSFFIGPLFTNTADAEEIYHAAEESNVLLQFSHWPTMAPASKWMAKKISRPAFLQIIREISHTQYLETGPNFDDIWIDELAFCLRWVDGAVHHIDVKTVEFTQGKVYALHLLLRFDSGATANIYINVAGDEAKHHRIAANNHYLAKCNVLDQSVRLGEQNEDGHLFFQRHSFDAAKSAELSAMEFIKSIQFKRPTIYNNYHLLELTKTLDKIKKRMNRF